MKTSGYSLENAQSFGWASVTGNLNQARVSCLQKYLVGNEILDAGCGGGGYVKFLTGQGLNVTGVDKYEDFLQVARQQDPQGTYIQSDIADLPFEENAFDCTFCFDVLEHVDDYSAVAELARVTSRRLILVVPREDKSLDPYGLTLRHYIDHTHLRYYTQSSLTTLANSISPRKVSVHSELPIDFAGIFEQIAQVQSAPKLSRLARLMTKYFMLRQVLGQASRLKLPRANHARQIARQRTEHFLRDQVFSQFSFPQIYTGLVAIVDLDKS